MAEVLIDVGETVTLVDALIVLGELLAWLVVVALCAIVVAFVYSILWPISKVVSASTFGLIGSVPGTHAVESAVTSALSSSVASLDKKAGKFFNALKHLVENVAEEIFGLAVLGAYLAWYVSPAHLANVIANHISKFVRSVHQVEAKVKGLTREVHRVEAKVSSLPSHLARRLTAVEHAIDTTIPREIKSARELAKEAEAEAAKAWDFVKSKPWEIGATAFAGAVALALTSLGLGWLKCDANPFNHNPKACGLWSVLGRLLGLAAFLTVAFDFRQFVTASDDVAVFIGKAVGSFEGKFPLALPPLPPPE